MKWLNRFYFSLLYDYSTNLVIVFIVLIHSAYKASSSRIVHSSLFWFWVHSFLGWIKAKSFLSPENMVIMTSVGLFSNMISYCLNCCLIVWSVTINQWLPRRTFELFTESSMLCCCCCWALFWPDELGYNSALHNHAGNVPEAITKHAAGLLLRGTEVEGRQQWRRHNGGAVWDRDSDRLRTGWEQGPSPDQRLCCSVLWEVAHCEGCLCQEDHLRECPFLALGGLQPLQVWHCSPCPE